GFGQALEPLGNRVELLVWQPFVDDAYEHEAESELTAQVACDLSGSPCGRRLVDATDDGTNHRASSDRFLAASRPPTVPAIGRRTHSRFARTPCARRRAVVAACKWARGPMARTAVCRQPLRRENAM